MNRVLPALMVGLATWVLGGPVLVGGPASFLSRAEAGMSSKLGDAAPKCDSSASAVISHHTRSPSTSAAKASMIIGSR